MYLLDTNVVSELRKATSGRVDPHVLRWSQSVPPPLCHVSAMSILELEIGVRQTERRDAPPEPLLRPWMDGAGVAVFSPPVPPP